jgi:hypothetical protein
MHGGARGNMLRAGSGVAQGNSVGGFATNFFRASDEAEASYWRASR